MFSFRTGPWMWNVPSLLTPCSPMKSGPQVVNWPTVEALVALPGAAEAALLESNSKSRMPSLSVYCWVIKVAFGVEIVTLYVTAVVGGMLT